MLHHQKSTYTSGNEGMGVWGGREIGEGELRGKWEEGQAGASGLWSM